MKFINYAAIIRVLGSLLLIEAFFLLISGGVSLIYSEKAYQSFLLASFAAILPGTAAIYFTRNKKRGIQKREGFIIVSLVWIMFSFIGSIPFIHSGSIPNYTNAFFESISGFTTTGSSILNNIEELPRSILFWRSIIQWMGGMGIIVLSLAIMPILGIGGMQLFIAESPGPTTDKLHPRITEAAKRLWAIYAFFTLAEVILLKLGGMNWYNAVNHAFTTMATGGYSTKQASIAHFDSPFIHYVIIVFMFLAGVNFTLSYFAFKLKFRKILQNEELKFYLFFIIIFTLITTAVLYAGGYESFEKSFRDSAFQVVSIITSTGFATADYLLWPPFVWLLMFILMFFGSMSGSTGGGIKIMRIAVLIKNSVLEFKRLIHPNAVVPVRFSNKILSPQIVSNILAFIVLYMSIFILGTAVMSAFGLDFKSAMGAVISTLGNIGPGIGEVGPADNFANIPAGGKWFLSFLMLIGRLELFTVLVLFAPAFWKN
jgi:trk system potassium uptake protein TrkH